MCTFIEHWRVYTLQIVLYNIMATAYGAAGTAMATPRLSLHSNTLMLLYKSAKNYHSVKKLLLGTKIDIL